MHKPIFSLEAERTLPVQQGLLDRLERARTESGIVLATPTAVKSLALKFLELSRDLAQSHADSMPTGLTFGRVRIALSRGPRRTFGAHDARSELEGQLQLCAKAFRLMQQGALMLDEVRPLYRHLPA